MNSDAMLEIRVLHLLTITQGESWEKDLKVHPESDTFQIKGVAKIKGVYSNLHALGIRYIQSTALIFD